MDPFIGGALISGATSLLGGLFGRSSAKKDLAMQRQLINEQNEYNNPTNIRKRAEEAGFNPLSFIGPGVGLQTQTAQVNSGNYMGAAIADAGMAFAGAMADKAKFAETKKLNDLEMANAKLQNKILQLTLRPKVGGVYAERQSTPTIAAAVGGGNENVSNVSAVASASAGHSVPSGGTSGPTPLLNGQKLQEQPTPELTGFMRIRNALAPDGFYVPGSDGEPLDIWQLPVVIGSYYADKGMRFLDKYSSGDPYLGADISVERVKPPTAAQTKELQRKKRVRDDFAARYGW